MVLYCITHGGNILRAFIHKFKYHDDEEAVFIVDKDVSTLYCPHVDKIKYYQMPAPMEIADADWPPEKIKKVTDKTLSDFFKGINVDPLQFSHVYALFDIYNPFILYFELNSIKYMLIEFWDWQFWHHAANISIMRNLKFRNVIQEMHLNDACGKNCIKAFLCSRKYARRDIIEDHVDIDIYDFYDNLANMDEKHKRQLIEGYHMDQYDFNAVLILNSAAVTKGNAEGFRSAMPYKFKGEDPNIPFYSFYKTVIDYYFNDVDFALKLHPESGESFRKTFADFKQLPKEIPMEAFLLLGKKFDIFCPSISTSMATYQMNDFNIVSFELTIYSFVRQIHFVFLAFTLINAICPPSTIYVQGIAPQQLDNFTSWAYTDFKDVEFLRINRDNVKNAVFIVADDPSDDFMDIIKGAPADCLIIFSGSRSVDERIFAKQEMIYSIIDVSDGEETDMRKCCWTIMSKNKELIDVLRDFSASYVLERSRMKIQTAPHN